MPFRQAKPGQVLIYQFRLRPTGTAEERRAVLEQDQLMEQLRLAHELRNKLVEIEHEHEAALKSLWLSDAAVATAEAALTQAVDAVDALVKRAKAERETDRSNSARPATSKEITAARKTRREAAAARKAAVAQARPAMKAREQELRQQHAAAIKGTYAEFCQTRGLYWATWGRIRDHHVAATRRVLSDRKKGKPAQLRFKRWDGTGTLTVSLHRESKDGPRTPELLASGGGKWRNVLQFGSWMDPVEWSKLPLSERRRAARTHVIWKLATGVLITLPVEMSRMIPAEADVIQAELVITRNGARREGTINVTVRLPEPDAATGAPVAVHLGWRRHRDGSMRVATWATSQRLAVPKRFPQHIRDMLLLHPDGDRGEIVLPAQWLEDLERVNQIRSSREVTRGRIIQDLAEWLDEHPQPDPDPTDPDCMLTGARVRQWRSGAPLEILARRWRAGAPVEPGGCAIADALEIWRQQDRYRWNVESGLRRKLIRRRNDAYRVIASWLTESAGAVVVDNADYQDTRRKTDVADRYPLLQEFTLREIRSRAAFASPGQFRAVVLAIGMRRGALKTEVETRHLSRQHLYCGHIAVGDDDQYLLSATVTCPNCGRTYDQDHNAAALMLERARSQTAEHEQEAANQRARSSV